MQRWRRTVSDNFHPGVESGLGMLRSNLALVLNIKQKVNERVCVVHPAQIENDAGMETG
jgi:hypothetical protein